MSRGVRVVVRNAVLGLVVATIGACSSTWEAPDVEPAPSRTVTTTDVAVLCGGAGRAEGGGYVAESCTGPADAAVGTSTGSGYVWVAGPSEIVSR